MTEFVQRELLTFSQVRATPQNRLHQMSFQQRLQFPEVTGWHFEMLLRVMDNFRCHIKASASTLYWLSRYNKEKREETCRHTCSTTSEEFGLRANAFDAWLPHAEDPKGHTATIAVVEDGQDSSATMLEGHLFLILSLHPDYCVRPFSQSERPAGFMSAGPGMDEEA